MKRAIKHWRCDGCGWQAVAVPHDDSERWAITHDTMPSDATMTAADDATLRTLIAILTEPHASDRGCDAAITRLPTTQTERQPT